MDKNKIKSFAVWSRRNLICAVKDRARYIGIFIDDKGKYNELKAEPVQGGFKLEGVDGVFKLPYKDREVLVNRIKSYNDRNKGFEQVMEEVAYTWFNRFMGLRYMEVNEYLPTDIRVLSSEVEGKTEPDVITRVSKVIDELNLNADYLYELLDSGKTEDREEAYKHILVKQCNELGKIIPQMFEKIGDYTELLLPDNLLEEGSVIRRLVEDIEEEDWKEEVEIIGWMYQYYIAEKKDEVFAALKKNVKITKENIPAATQLFTPKWIVKYMVENSLGRLWLEGHPNEELQKGWKYYLEEAEQEPEVEEELKKIREEHSQLKPEDIKVLDPCMGSGHILVYAFDILYEIYKTAGYSEREIPRLILQNNLYGLDIDDRAAQLASFALIMKARHYNRRLFRDIEREHLDLNLCSIQESNSIHKEAIDYFCSLDTELDSDELENDLEYLWSTFEDAKEYGSILEVKEVNFEALKRRLKEIEEDQNFTFGDYRKMLLDKLPALIKQAEIMSRKYEICITNPPYMGIRMMGNNLTEYINEKYPLYKYDLFEVIMYKIFCYTKKTGFMSMITMQSWLFLSTFFNIREYIINENELVCLNHLGSRAFDDIGGEVVQTVAFILRNAKVDNFLGKYTDLTKYGSCYEKEMVYLKKSHEITYVKNKDVFRGIPYSNFSYWISDKLYNIFKNEKRLKAFVDPKQGMATSNNDKYLKLWHEVDSNNMNSKCDNSQSANESNKRWFPYNKGGGYRKWYGNSEYLINWKEDGKEVKDYASSLYKSFSRTIKNTQFFFKECITWSKVSTNNISLRYIKDSHIFDVAGCSIFDLGDIKFYLLGFLNSKVTGELIKIISTSINYEVGNLKELPIKFDRENLIIDNLVNSNIIISKNDWDSFETSWDFKIHPLLKLLDKGAKHNLSAIFRIWETECEEAFEQLKHNEEELNRIFIDIYGLQDELTPEVEDRDITIRKADRERDVKSFISYAVGCMFGRYSIDAEGLIYAGGEWKDKWIVENGEWRVRKQIKNEDGEIEVDQWVKATFIPDGDNVIPITEDEYFEDDIVSRFIEFVRTVYSEETLDFIADSIGRKPSETARQAIRRYFIKDFYKDHLKVYQKRPIYWMFESGKNDGFKALIYMHRYNEQTVSRVRTDYLHALQRKYEAEIQRQQLIADSEEYTAKDRTAAKKKIDRITKQIEECREYDQVVAHLANEKISIDLDDGVKANYDKFQGIKVINSKGKEVKMDLLVKI